MDDPVCRKRLRERLSLHPVENIPDFPYTSGDIELADAQLDLLKKAIDALPPQRKKIFELCKLQGKSYEEVAWKVRVYISAISYNNIYYILRQSLSNHETMRLLGELSEMAEITDVAKSIIRQSLKSDFKDFEDAIQYYSALSIPEIDFIITRDTRDFKKSDLPVMTPSEASRLFENS